MMHDGWEWSPDAALQMTTFNESPRKADGDAARLTQMKAFARRITITEYYRGQNIELRRLPRPIYRYQNEEAGLIDGGLFNFAHGTNPEAITVIECRQLETGSEWSYGFLPLAGAAITAKLDGKTVWSRRIGKVGAPDQRPSYPGARSTPTLDGRSLYALGSDGDLACLDAATGEVRWQKNVRTEFGGKHGTWAYAESPLIDGDVVVCTPGGPEATLVALNKQTGSVVWKSSIPSGGKAAYSSAIIAEVGGVRQYVQFLAKGVVGVEAKTGKVLWRYDETAKGSPANIPTPIEHDGYVYSASSRGGGGLVKLTANNGAFEAEETYHSAKLPTAIGGAVRIGNYLYGTTGKSLLCVEFTTGKVVWQQRRDVAGSLCYADGLLYIHGETGEMALVEATPEAYREKGRFTPPNAPDRGKSKTWAYPIVADGRLYIREVGTVWCFDVKAHPSVN